MFGGATLGFGQQRRSDTAVSVVGVDVQLELHHVCVVVQRHVEFGHADDASVAFGDDAFKSSVTRLSEQFDDPHRRDARWEIG